MRFTLRITTLHDKLLDNTVEKHTLILVDWQSFMKLSR